MLKNIPALKPRKLIRLLESAGCKFYCDFVNFRGLMLGALGSVNRDVPDGAAVMGVPARVIKRT